MSSLKYIANAELMTVALGAQYTAGSGTMTLAAGTGAFLPTTGDFWIRQANTLASTLINICKVTARAGDVLTVVGGQDGTTDQNIIIGTPMTWTLCFSALTQLRADIAATTSTFIIAFQPVAQSAGVGVTNLATSISAGLYQLSAYFQVQSTNATDLFLNCTVSWTSNGVAKTSNIINSMNLGTANLQVDNILTMRADAGSTISFVITVAAGTFGYLPTLVLYKLL